MSSEHEVTHQQHHRHKDVAKKFENLIGVLMVIAIAILAVGLVYGILQTGSTTPSYMK